MLRVSLIGHLGADATVRQSQKGASITAFRVAVNQVRTGPDGDRQESTEWFSVQAAGRQAEFAGQLSRGTRVFVDGRLSISHYTSRDGETRVGYDIWADDIQNLSPRPVSEEPVGAASGLVGTHDADDGGLDDLPF
jgi:single-strand DNA-binding protein